MSVSNGLEVDKVTDEVADKVGNIVVDKVVDKLAYKGPGSVGLGSEGSGGSGAISYSKRQKLSSILNV